MLRLDLLQRHRAARARLRHAPWALGAGFGLAVFAMTLLCRIGMFTLAQRAGVLKALGPRHLAWLGPALAQGLAVVLALTLLLGGLLHITRTRPRARLGVLSFGYALVILASLIGIVSVPLYGALQSTLQLTQLLLAGGIGDLLGSGLEVVPAPVAASGLLLLLLACWAVPWFALTAARLGQALRAPRGVACACVLAVGIAGSSQLAPGEGAGGLQVDPVYEFSASAARYLLRARVDRALIDMRGAPHFDRSLIRGDKRSLEPLSKLANVQALPQTRQNVVLIVLESAANSQYGIWDGPAETTPRLRELSAQGLRFDDYYTPSPVSMKSLFSLHCSSYPHPHPNAETYINPALDCQSISEILKAEGYRTALFHGGRFSYTHKDAFFNSRGFDVMRDADTLSHRRRYAKVAWGVDDRAVVDDAIEWLGKGGGKQPFFLDVIFLSPHHPYDLRNVPTPFGKKTDIERYRNSVLFIDGQIGRLYDFLKAQGKADDTLFVIVGDHGEAFGEHPGHFMHGTRLYDEAVRTPMMLVHSRLFSGARTGRPGNHVDLVPTVLDVLGLPKPERHQGQSLLRGYTPKTLHFYGDWHRHYLGLRDGQWKYIYDLDRETHELFDLSKDRREQKNLAPLHRDQIALYKKRVLDWERFYQELIPNYDLYVVTKGACPGRGSCYLDELKPVLQVGDLRANKNVVGYPLQIGKRRYARGLGVKAPSILRYSLRGQGFERLTGAVGHHAQGGRNPNSSLKVSVEIYLDDRLLWSSGKLVADADAVSFDLDIEDGTMLELIGHDVDGEDWHDWIDWVDVRLQR